MEKNRVYIGRYKVAGVADYFLSEKNSRRLKEGVRIRMLKHLKHSYMRDSADKIKWVNDNAQYPWNFDLEMEPYLNGYYEAEVYIKFDNNDDAVLFRLST